MRDESFLFRNTAGEICRQRTLAYQHNVYTENLNLPTQWEICSGCKGEGKSSAYLGSFSSDDMNEDPEFYHDYMSGMFDRSCTLCHGSGKVRTIMYHLLPVELAIEIAEFEFDEGQDDTTQQAEIAMGA